MIEEFITSILSPAFIWVLILVFFILTIVLSWILVWHWNRYGINRASIFLAKVSFFTVTGIIWIGIFILAVMFTTS